MAEERSRKAAKGWLSRACSRVDEMAAVSSASRDGEWRVSASVALNELDKRLDTFDAAQAAVEAVIDEEQLLNDIEKSGLFRDAVLGSRAKLMAAVQSEEAQAAASVGSHTELKLPKLDLPTFSGDVLDWPSFWQTFQNSVGDRTDLADIVKLTYLKTLLKGEAAVSIAGLTVTGPSYQTAVSLLKERFGRSDLIIFKHVQGLLNMGEAKDMKAFQDELLIHVRSLEALGISGDTYGVILTPLVLSKLPKEIRLEWARGGSGHESDLEWLLQFLKVETERRERSGVYGDLVATTTRDAPRARTGPAAQGAPPAQPGRRDGTSRRRQPAAVSAAALQSSSRATGSCGFCQLQHPTAKCREWLKLSCRERFQQVKEKGLCFCCLGSGHHARSCAARCAECNGRHHATCCLRAERVTSGTRPCVGEGGSLGAHPTPVEAGGQSQPQGFTVM